MFRRTILIIFILSIAFSVAFSFSGISDPAEEYPVIYIDPQDASGWKVGETFTVAVVVYNLVGKNLYGFDIKLRWDTSSLEYISHEAKVPVEVYADGVLHEPLLEVKNEVNVIEGTCWIAYASLAPADPFNEDGIFFTLSFKVVKESNSKFTFEHLFLANQRGEVIPLFEQHSESSGGASDSVMNEHRKLRAQKWLEWWIKVTWQMTKRRPTAAGR